MNPDDLKSKLDSWQVDPPIPSGFQREVWARIAAREASQRAGFWQSLKNWFTSELPKPQWALSLVALAFFTSFGMANLKAHYANTQAWQQLESRYAFSLDPVAQASLASMVPHTSQSSSYE